MKITLNSSTSNRYSQPSMQPSRKNFNKATQNLRKRPLLLKLTVKILTMLQLSMQIPLRAKIGSPSISLRARERCGMKASSKKLIIVKVGTALCKMLSKKLNRGLAKCDYYQILNNISSMSWILIFCFC